MPENQELQTPHKENSETIRKRHSKEFMSGFYKGFTLSLALVIILTLMLYLIISVIS